MASKQTCTLSKSSRAKCSAVRSAIKHVLQGLTCPAQQVGLAGPAGPVDSARSAGSSPGRNNTDLGNLIIVYSQAKVMSYTEIHKQPLHKVLNSVKETVL